MVIRFNDLCKNVSIEGTCAARGVTSEIRNGTAAAGVG
jgi:hypothetical protein